MENQAGKIRFGSSQNGQRLKGNWSNNVCIESKNQTLCVCARNWLEIDVWWYLIFAGYMAYEQCQKNKAKYCKIWSPYICFYFFLIVHVCVVYARVNPCIYLFIYLRSFDILIRVYSLIRCQCVLWMICVAKRSGPHSRCSPNKLEYHISCWKCECAKKKLFC